jgi:hypothetical protein
MVAAMHTLPLPRIHVFSLIELPRGDHRKRVTIQFARVTGNAARTKKEEFSVATKFNSVGNRKRSFTGIIAETRLVEKPFTPFGSIHETKHFSIGETGTGREEMGAPTALLPCFDVRRLKGDFGLGGCHVLRD